MKKQICVMDYPKTEFKKSMDKLVDHFKRCIESNGTYFE